jgi:DNA-binding SARP family transcriptional activator/TolB-like protein/Tfp pilus assembly protein PilF
MIRLRTLGGVDLSGPDGLELRPILAQPKRLALLVYLALASPTRYRRRDTILALFWPESDTEHARASLRQALRFLRRSLGEGVILTRGEEEIGVDPGALEVDAIVFGAACDSGNTGQAMKVWGGDFLEGVFVADAPDLEQWVSLERERLRSRAVEASWALADAGLRSGSGDIAGRWARRAVGLAPLDESGVQRLIEMLDRLGDRAGAVQAYEDLRRQMAVHLEAEPSALTHRLIEALRTPSPAPAHRVVTTSAELGAGASEEPSPVSYAEPRPRSRRAMVAAVALAAVAAGAVVSQPESNEAGPITSLAVLPLASPSADSSLEYLGEGLTEALINALAAVPDLRLTSRSVVFRYQGSASDPSDIGRKLGVQSVLTWTVRRRGDRLQVQAELLRVTDGSRVWGEQYDRPASDPLDLQEQIATAVTRQLGRRKSLDRIEGLPRRPTSDLEAWDLYSRAAFLMRRRGPGGRGAGREGETDSAALDAARRYLERAVARDSMFALAWSQLADYHAAQAFSGTQPEENWAKAELFARRALSADSTCADAHSVLGIVLVNGYRNEDAGVQSLKRAMELDPANPLAHMLYGERLLLRWRFDQAIDQMRLAVEADPADYGQNLKLGWALLVARRYDLAIPQLRRTEELLPGDFAAPKLLSFAYERSGMFAEAAEAKEKSLLFEGDTVQAERLRRAYRSDGVAGYWRQRREALRRELASLEARARKGDADTAGLVWAHAQLGHRNEAFALLGRIGQADPVALRDLLWIWLVDSLRPDPRFAALVRLAGLPLENSDQWARQAAHPSIGVREPSH